MPVLTICAPPPSPPLNTQIYTDTITFAPLSSTFLGAAPPLPPATSGSVVSTPSALASENQPPVFARVGGQQSQSSFSSSADAAAARSRKDWIADWERSNPDRPRPPSAKSVYRLADSEYFVLSTVGSLCEW